MSRRLENSIAVIIIEKKCLNFVARPNRSCHENKHRPFRHTRARDEPTLKFAEASEHILAIPRKRPPAFEKSFVVRANIPVRVFASFGFGNAVGKNGGFHALERGREALSFKHRASLEINDESFRSPVACDNFS